MFFQVPSGVSGWHFGLFFSFSFIKYLEIRDLALGDKKLTIEGPADKETAEEYQSECGVWNFGNGNGDHTWPILSVMPL